MSVWSSVVCFSDLPAGDAVVAVLGSAFDDVLHQQPPARAQRGQFLGKLDLALDRLFAGNPALAPGHRIGDAAAAPQHGGADAAVGDAPGIERRGQVQRQRVAARSEEHTSELQSLMRISYAVFCLKKKR